ncbi:uncharacterized protein LOC129601778 [Paramacrobiotus metropolitanus]|uniref:uncharacterized protein LOC129601778 n=1 Tax=Paramacrobiotus metropolitanus TaxID=2943436 RepID=UPI0024456F1D|nr:uncharacterized protein LOC129601778 [Paramacrobiotus metropolitanus]
MCFLVCLVSGRLCQRIKQRLRGETDTVLVDTIVQDHTALCRCIKRFSEHLGVFFLLFYLQATLWIVWIINSVAGSRSTVYLSAGVQIQSGIVLLIVLLTITLAMIYVHEQADISDELQDTINAETDGNKCTKLLAALHRVTAKPTGFSIAGIIVVDRSFIATMVGILFSYGTFILQLKESRDEGGSRHHSSLINSTATK